MPLALRARFGLGARACGKAIAYAQSARTFAGVEGFVAVRLSAFFGISRRFECDFIAVCDRDGNRNPNISVAFNRSPALGVWDCLGWLAGKQSLMLKALGLLQGLKVLLLPDFLRFFVMSRRFECNFSPIH